MEARAGEALQLQRPLAAARSSLLPEAKTRTKAALHLKRRRADVVSAVGKKAPQKAGPQYLLHEGVPAQGLPS